MHSSFWGNVRQRSSMKKAHALRSYSVSCRRHSETTVFFLGEIKTFANLSIPVCELLSRSLLLSMRESIVKPEKIRTIMRNHDPKFNDFPKFKLDSEIQRRDSRKLKAVRQRQTRI